LVYRSVRENGFSDNRKKILGIAEKYGCDLFLNGHEHNPEYPVGRAGSMSVVNCGSVTSPKGGGAFAVVEMLDDRAVFTIYSRAVAVQSHDGAVSYTDMPRRLFVREVPLKPLKHTSSPLNATGTSHGQ